MDGNSSDKVSFHETIKRVEEFRAEIDIKEKFKWIADSALYTKKGLLKSNDYVWVTHVPETIAGAKDLVEKVEDEIKWEEREGGYKTSEYKSSYGGIEQRWLLVFSQQAYEREKNTLEKKLEREEKELKQALWHFGNKKFHCQEDARKAFEELKKEYKFHKIDSEITPKGIDVVYFYNESFSFNLYKNSFWDRELMVKIHTGNCCPYLDRFCRIVHCQERRL